MQKQSRNWLYVFLACFGLFLVYLFQDQLNFFSGLQGKGWKILYSGTDYIPDTNRVEYVVNKTLRYLLNDLLSILLIHGIFLKKRYTDFAFVLMAFGLVFLLPLYFYLYFASIDGFSSMISHLHRIILNPVLMMLLIPALLYQQSKEKNSA